MDLLVSADDAVSQERPGLMALPESTYGSENYAMHLNQASQMEASPRVTPPFELQGGTWQMQDEAANRHWKCVMTQHSKCYYLIRNLLKTSEALCLGSCRVIFSEQAQLALLQRLRDDGFWFAALHPDLLSQPVLVVSTALSTWEHLFAFSWW